MSTSNLRQNYYEVSSVIINEARSLTLESFGRARNMNEDPSMAGRGWRHQEQLQHMGAGKENQQGRTCFLGNVKVLVSESFSTRTK